MPRFLLVTNSQTLVERLSRQIAEPLNAELLQAESDQEAVQIVNRTLPDLVIIDAQTPQLVNEPSFCRALQEPNSAQQFPVLLLSRAQDEAPEVYACSLFAGEMIALPASSDALLPWISLLLRWQSGISQLQPPAPATALPKLMASEAPKTDFNAQELRQLVDALAHQIRNPLTGISANVQYLQMNFPATPTQQETYSDIIESVRNLDRITREAVECVKPMRLNLMAADLNRLVLEAAAECENLLQERMIELTTRLSPALPPLEVDPVRLRRALIGLLEHCVADLPESGEIALSSKMIDGEAVLEFASRGKSLWTEPLAQIKLPLQTLMSPAGGLGMALVKRILDEHSCRIEIEKESEGCTRFLLTLPCTIKP